MSVNSIRQATEQKMSRSVEALKASLAKLRTGRAHAGILDHVTVDYYGSHVPLNQVANVTLVDARTIGVSVWDKKMAGAVEKAIRDSDLGLNPAAMGELIRVPMPPLSEERRRELVKVVKHEGESARVAVRNLRRDANNEARDLLKAKQISEDEERRSQDDIQKLTDKTIAEIDRLLAAKEQEVMTV